jgi:hypothetical protein
MKKSKFTTEKFDKGYLSQDIKDTINFIFTSVVFLLKTHFATLIIRKLGLILQNSDQRKLTSKLLWSSKQEKSETLSYLRGA